ncbi:hypothetical protein NQ315_014738 [Exocentrus adspersus]|uniref:DDE Tnp4 domain-containing protein n=1 Tax=Exocentrus adspersus TaxID=1586481 RepID=A0AAV8VEU6_9CUCU|nr:hypothetical protein NQ315_014738 [Exocentrus adspersus]
MDDLSFFRRFRLYKETVLHVLQQIEHNLEFNNDLNNSVSNINQLLTTLQFYATCGHQTAIGDFMRIHQSAVSRIISKVSQEIARLGPQYITMPNRQEQIHIQSRFYNIFKKSPAYFCSAVFNNLPMELKALNLMAYQRELKRYLTDRCDSGYALKSYLLTPLLNPVSPEEIRYNEAHIRTRNSVERTFGVWKRRFPVLAYGLRCKLENALTTIVATAVLHNIARRQNEREPPPPEYINFEQLQYLIGQDDIQPEAGHRVNENRIIHDNRRNLITNYFENL